MMRCCVKFISAVILVTVLAAVVLVVTCSAWNGSKEATTRKDQEAAFFELLDITPPASITSKLTTSTLIMAVTSGG
jgi:hypothetical protein